MDENKTKDSEKESIQQIDSSSPEPEKKKKNSPEKIIAIVLASLAGLLLLLALAAGGFVLYTGSLRPSMFQERSTEEMEKVRVQVVQASTPTPSPPPLGEIVDADWIDETPWTFSILPSLGPELNDENADRIKELIDKCIDDKSYLEGREKARQDIWVNIGESAKRSADFIIKKVNAIEDAAAKKAMQEKIEKKKQLEEKMKKTAKKSSRKDKEVKA